LIFDEPTRGIDVGSKAEIHAFMNDFVGRGGSILMISSELSEIIGMSDRVYVMRQGKIVSEISREEATQEKIMSYAFGASGA
jgi:ribose transport system ATP-binding protein